MSNYDRKLWERLCKVEEPVTERVSNPDWLDHLNQAWENRPIRDTEWRANTTGIYEQLLASGQIRDVAQPAPPIDFAQLQANLYALAGIRGHSIFDERAEEYRRRRALEALESEAAQRRWFADYWSHGLNPFQPIDP